MTKVQTRIKLWRELDENELKNIAKIHAVYGMLMVRLEASGREVLIEYDASRLSLAEVRETFDRFGIPIV